MSDYFKGRPTPGMHIRYSGNLGTVYSVRNGGDTAVDTCTITIAFDNGSSGAGDYVPDPPYNNTRGWVMHSKRLGGSEYDWCFALVSTPSGKFSRGNRIEVTENNPPFYKKGDTGIIKTALAKESMVEFDKGCRYKKGKWWVNEGHRELL